MRYILALLAMLSPAHAIDLPTFTTSTADGGITFRHIHPDKTACFADDLTGFLASEGMTMVATQGVGTHFVTGHPVGWVLVVNDAQTRGMILGHFLDAHKDGVCIFALVERSDAL